MNAKEKLLIKLIIFSVFLAIFISTAFYLYASNTKEIDRGTLIELEQSESVKLKIKNIYCDKSGNISIEVLTKNDNIRYPYHNWTLWDGEGPYKNIQIVIIQNETIIAGKTYPKNIALSESDIKEGYIQSDGCISYMRGISLENNYKVGVIFSDRVDKQYIIYQE